MSDFRIDKITNRDGSSGTQIAGITTFSGTSGMQLPVGPTEYRGGRGRGIWAGGIPGSSSSTTNVIEMIEIATTGSATDFGDTAFAGGYGAAFGTYTKGIICGGGVPGPTWSSLSGIQAVIFSTTGGAFNFGDLSTATTGASGFSNSTRGFICGRGTFLDSSPASADASTNVAKGIDIRKITVSSDGAHDGYFGDMTQALTIRGTCASPTRGIMAGGDWKGNHYRTDIDYINLASEGNALEFGNLTVDRDPAGFSSSTRGVFAGGRNSPGSGRQKVIDYVTIATTGNAIDFGDLVDDFSYLRGCSSQTRGVTAGGSSPQGNTNTIQYVTIATLGNSLDFGNMTEAHESGAALASKTRGVMAGGQSKNVIDYVTIMSTGNAVDFGDMSTATSTSQAMANATRGVIKKRLTPSYTNAIDYLTIATKGNSSDFGDFINNSGNSIGCASKTRGTFCGGYGSPACRTAIGSIEFATTGDALDFGDLTYTADHQAGSSSGHGGL